MKNEDITVTIKTLENIRQTWADQIPNEREKIADYDAIAQAIRCVKEYADAITSIK